MTEKQRRSGSCGVSGLLFILLPQKQLSVEDFYWEELICLWNNFEYDQLHPSYIQMTRIMEAKRPGRQLGRGTHGSLHWVFLWFRNDPRVSCDYGKWAHEWPWVSTLIGLGAFRDQLHISFWRRMARPIGQKIQKWGLWQRTGSHSSWRSCIPIIYWQREPSLGLSRLCFPSLVFGGDAGRSCRPQPSLFRAVDKQGEGTAAPWWLQTRSVWWRDVRFHFIN